MCFVDIFKGTGLFVVVLFLKAHECVVTPFLKGQGFVMVPFLKRQKCVFF